MEAGEVARPWRVSTVGEEFSIQLGKMLDAGRNVGTSKPYLGNSAVRWGRIDLSKVGSVPLTPSDLEKYRLHAGDLLVCEGGEVGRAAIWNDELPECYYQKALHRARPKGDFEPRLLMYFLELWSAWGLLSNFVTQTSIAHLTKEKFRLVPLPVPPADEQRRVAQALANADALVRGLRRLLAKKRDVQHATMRQLLTGRTRLPGFSGSWGREPLGTLTTWLSGGTPNRAQARFWNGHIPWITAATLARMSISTSDQHLTDAGVKAGSRLAPVGATLLLVRGSALHSTIKLGHVVEPVAFNQDVKAIVPNERLDPEYLTFALKAAEPDLLRKVTSATNSAGVLETRTVQSTELDVPSRDEQRAIATVLANMDCELQALERRLAKTCDIKQGMMQELLTGRTRLIPTGEASATEAPTRVGA